MKERFNFQRIHDWLQVPLYLEYGTVKLHHFGMDVQVTDILSKPLGKVKIYPHSKRSWESWKFPSMMVTIED